MRTRWCPDEPSRQSRHASTRPTTAGGRSSEEQGPELASPDADRPPVRCGRGAHPHRDGKRGDLDAGDVQEAVVVAGEGQARDARVKEVAVELRAVALALEEGAVALGEVGEARRAEAGGEDDQIAGDLAPVGVVSSVSGPDA